MHHLKLVPSQRAALPGNDWGFNSRDLIALTCWIQRSDVHGYRRMLVEGGSAEGGPEEGGYVLIYAPSREWARWGIARSGDDLVVWNCGTGADLGRFPTMLQALDSLPPVHAPARLRRKGSGPMTGNTERGPTEPPRSPPRLFVVHPN